jgi:hypothetical protein
MRRQIRSLGATAMIAMLTSWSGAPAAQSKDDPFLGRWTLDRARSEFSGAPPERRVTIFELMPDGRMKHITETVVANGSTDRVEYSYKYDGNDNPIENSFLSTVSVKRINARTNERTGKVRGEVVETSTRTVSADGKTLTISINGMNDGTEYSSNQVFRKESTK